MKVIERSEKYSECRMEFIIAGSMVDGDDMFCIQFLSHKPVPVIKETDEIAESTQQFQHPEISIAGMVVHDFTLFANKNNLKNLYETIGNIIKEKE